MSKISGIENDPDSRISLRNPSQYFLCSIRGIVVDQDYLKMIHGGPRETFRYSPDKLLHIPLFVSTPGNNAKKRGSVCGQGHLLTLR